jgi:hypothetical protein
MALFGWLVASQPAVFFSHTNSASATSHQSANSIFLSQRISLSYQPPASRTRPISPERSGDSIRELWWSPHQLAIEKIAVIDQCTFSLVLPEESGDLRNLLQSVENTAYFPVLCPWYHRRVPVVGENVLLQTVFSERKHRCPIPMHHRTFPVSDWTLPIYYWTQSFLVPFSVKQCPFRWSFDSAHFTSSELLYSDVSDLMHDFYDLQ